MKELFTALAQSVRCGVSAVLCTVTESQGSTPRGPGAMMAVFPGGRIAGTVGGGRVEYECIQRALHVLDEGADALERYVLTPNQVADLGMICGGNQSVYFRFAAGGDGEAAALFERAAALFREQSDSWLFTRLRPGGRAECDLFTQGAFLFGRFPAPDEGALPRLSPRLADGVLIQPLSRSETVYVFGGGHVSQALVPLLAALDFPVVVYDERPEFTDPALFPAALRTVCAPYPALLEHIDPKPNDYAVVMTRGHEGDYAVQRSLLTRPMRYIGVIGSRRKAALQRQRLLDEGFSDEQLAVIHSPVGLPIGAQTPAEIAVSVAAELIKLRSENG